MIKVYFVLSCFDLIYILEECLIICGDIFALK